MLDFCPSGAGPTTSRRGCTQGRQGSRVVGTCVTEMSTVKATSRLAITGAALLLSLSLSLTSSAAAPSNTPTAGTVQVAGTSQTVKWKCPPAGFDPVTADNATLAEYGFPTRPSSAAAQAAWLSAMKSWRQCIVPRIVASSSTRANTGTATGWSGGVIYAA